MTITDDPTHPDLTHGADTAPGPQAQTYLVLSEAERAKGFVRPLRHSYRHQGCGAVTSMTAVIAETYARDPHFYGATYCVGCRMHRPVGAQGEFFWNDGADPPQRVGT